MHEGLLIVNKGEGGPQEANPRAQKYATDRFVIFCNRPANKLFTAYLGQPLILQDNNCNNGSPEEKEEPNIEENSRG